MLASSWEGYAFATSSKRPLNRQEVKVEDVHFRCGVNQLAGSLFLPKGPGPHPAVVLILGSGEQDRSYGGVATALGREFARQGFACLTWDKPGVGKSTGDFNAQTFRDRANETLEAVRFLRRRADIRPRQVGIWGHSQGGMVAPLAASLSRDVAFLIEVAGWQGPAWQQDIVRVEAELRAGRFAPADIRQAAAFARKRMGLIRGTGPFEELDKAQEAVKGAAWFGAVQRCDRTLFHAARRCVEFDTGPCWERVRCPVLVIYGDHDTSSGPPQKLVAIIRRGLKKAGNQDVTVRIFRDADHSLSRTESGGQSRSRKKSASPQFVTGYIETMLGWLDKRFPPGG
jgi:pimeloyl-ACP methyl ester carboxylesterase